ncbi:hypothetical protein pb186bvf_007205 [Paramecium bursaria]
MLLIQNLRYVIFMINIFYLQIFIIHHVFNYHPTKILQQQPIQSQQILQAITIIEIQQFSID